MRQQIPPPRPEDDTSLDLDQRIALVEQRLIARRTRVGEQIQSLGQRATDTISSGRVALPVLAGGAALTLLWLMLRKRAPSHPAHNLQHRAPRRGALSTLLWAQLPALAMALLPAQWKLGKPSGHSALLASLVPLVRRRFAASDDGIGADDPTPVDNVDLQRYSGSWLQSARLPQATQDSADGLTSLTFRSNGRALQVERRSLRVGRRARVAQGVVRVMPDSGGARLKLSFAPGWLRWLPGAWEDHWVLHLEPDYSAALVGNRQRTKLALMVRRFEGCEGALDRMLVAARQQGYAVEELEFVSSANIRSSAAPVPPAANAARRRENVNPPDPRQLNKERFHVDAR